MLYYLTQDGNSIVSTIILEKLLGNNFIKPFVEENLKIKKKHFRCRVSVLFYIRHIQTRTTMSSSACKQTTEYSIV